MSLPRWLMAASVALLLAFGGWSFVRTTARVPEPASLGSATASSSAQAETSRRGESESASRQAQAAEAPKPSASPASSPQHPHPITPQHERIYRENWLVGSLNGAMDVRDSAGLRRLLAQYRDEYPEDAHELQRGYELIADCMDSPGEATRSAAKAYYDRELASGLRRYIRRYCLE